MWKVFCTLPTYFQVLCFQSNLPSCSSVYRLRLFVTPKTQPIHEQSGRSWRRWDTRSLWTCCMRSRLGGNSTSSWSIWVVRHPLFLLSALLQLGNKPLNIPVCFHQEEKYLCSLKKKASSWKTLLGEDPKCNTFWKAYLKTWWCFFFYLCECHSWMTSMFGFHMQWLV